MTFGNEPLRSKNLNQNILTSYGANEEWKKEFSQQIELFFNENKQSQEELDIKMKVMSRIEEIIERAVPNVQLRLYPYGSTTNCCGAKDSDIDIYMKATTRRQRKHFLNGILGFLELMKAQLTKEFGSDFKELELRNAAVPIINIIFGDKYKNLEVDLNGTSNNGIIASYLFRQYAKIDSRFAKLGLLIKSWAEKNKIYGSDNGGMNGISYLVMLVHYLQKGASPPVLPNLQELYPDEFRLGRDLEEIKFGNKEEDQLTSRILQNLSKNESSVVDLLIGFFKYYSNFSWRTEKITMDEDLFMKRGKRNKDNIFVKDPYGSPNLANGLKDDRVFKKTLYAFGRAYQMLSNEEPSMEEFMETIEWPEHLDRLYLEKLKKQKVPRKERRQKSMARRMNRLYL